MSGRRVVGIPSLEWSLLSAAFLLLAPTQLYLGQPVWESGSGVAFQAIGIVVAYVLASSLAPLLVRILRIDNHPGLSLVGLPSLTLASYFLALLVSTPSYSRGILLISSASFLVLLLFPLLVGRERRAAVGLLALVLLAVVGLGIASLGRSQSQLPSETRVVTTNRHLVRMRIYPDLVTTIPGGGLARLGGDILLATGDGRLHRVGLSGDSLRIESLGLRAPMNREEFLETVGGSIGADRRYFRLSGVLVRDVGDAFQVVLSHHYWKVDEQCFVLRLSETTLTSADPTPGAAVRAGSGPWTTLHETRPCLPIKSGGHAMAGHEAGGRMAMLGDSAIIVSVADHEFDGFNSNWSSAQDPNSDYGKTLLIPLDDRPAYVFTSGHRNPQGLLVSQSGEIWLTEHGPEGGDELNLLSAGANYGWPFETFGTGYGQLEWPLSGRQSEDSEIVGPGSPVFAWVPSIGVSNLIELGAEVFPRWEGDLLLASLRSQSLFRVRRKADRVSYVEPIRVGRYVRDLAVAVDGSVVLWTDAGGPGSSCSRIGCTGSFIVLTNAGNLLSGPELQSRSAPLRVDSLGPGSL